MRLGVHHAEVVGLGDEVLIAAAEELAGKIKNRRVEVWVRP
jgi:outer membrane protein OmpA-like peptidoglycan-associated protein